MNQSLLKALLFSVDLLLVFLILCVLPFAWILRDGLGTDSAQSTGMVMIGKTFMTFHVGPVIISLLFFDRLIRRYMSKDIVLHPRLLFPLISIGLALLAVLSFAVIAVMTG